MKAPKHKQVGIKPSPDNKHGARIQALTVLDGEEAPQRTVRAQGHQPWSLASYRPLLDGWKYGQIIFYLEYATM